MHSEALNDKEKVIFSLLRHFAGFYLGGGTALALHIGHRVSVDFDLFCAQEIPRDFLSDQVEKVFSGHQLNVSVNNPSELTVFVDGIKVTFLHYPFPVFSDLLKFDNVRLLAVKTIAATKAYTIGRRGSYKDYVDIYFILSGGYTSLTSIITLAQTIYGDEFNARLFLEQLVYLEDIEDADIVFLKKDISKDVVARFLTDEVKNISLEVD